MATYRMVARPHSSIVTTEFDTWNKAMDFYKASALLNPTKPYKKAGGGWKVSIVRTVLDKPRFERVPDWCKPFKGYDEWRNQEGLKKLPYGERNGQQYIPERYMAQ